MASMDDPSISTAFASGFIDHRAATSQEASGVESYFNTAMSEYQTKEIS
jgi:hypothetical protein